jgi:membrane protease YdiL (CAAX protease family)
MLLSCRRLNLSAQWLNQRGCLSTPLRCRAEPTSESKTQEDFPIAFSQIVSIQLLVAYSGVGAWASLRGMAVSNFANEEIALCALAGDVIQLTFALLIINRKLPSMALSSSITPSTLGLGATAAAASIASIAILQSLLPSPASSSQAIASLVDNQSSLGLASLALSNVIIGPLNEEVVWRGLLLRSLLNWTSSPIAAVLISSAAFAVWHLDSFNFLSLFVLGIWLGVAFVRGGPSGLTASLTAHTIYNALAASSLIFHY